MISRTMAAGLAGMAGQQATIAGWLHRKRQLKSMTFLIIRDRTGLAQAVLTEPEAIAAAARLPEETVLEVTGQVTAAPQAPGGAEITSPVNTALSDPAAPPALDVYRPEVTASLPAILDGAPATLRHPRLKAAFEVSAASVAGFRTALQGLGFTEVHSPKIVESATESGASTFGLDYFGRRAYLAQSPQFFKQALVGVFERVYETGPVFRAEPHDTARHLAEYVSLDAELGFIAGHRDVLAVLGQALAGMTAALRAEAQPALDLLRIAVPEIPAEIPVVHFREALAIAGAPADEPDLAPAHERAIGQWAAQEHGSDFVAVEGYPMSKRPVYTHPQPGDERWSNSFDLLFRGQELVTGGQRLHRHADYLTAIRARGEDPATYADYLEAFAHGMPPHGGFAIGLERWAGRLIRAENIREVTLFPRDLRRLAP